jgi:hypothetical protein
LSKDKYHDFNFDEFFERHKDLFKDLAEKIVCARCREVVGPPFFNLGDKYGSFEGCKKCYDLLHK